MYLDQSKRHKARARYWSPTHLRQESDSGKDETIRSDLSTTQIQKLSEATENTRNDAPLEGLASTTETHNLKECSEVRKAKVLQPLPHALEYKRPRLPLKQFHTLEDAADELRNDPPSEREASTRETPNL